MCVRAAINNVAGAPEISLSNTKKKQAHRNRKQNVAVAAFTDNAVTSVLAYLNDEQWGSSSSVCRDSTTDREPKPLVYLNYLDTQCVCVCA